MIESRDLSLAIYRILVIYLVDSIYDDTDKRDKKYTRSVLWYQYDLPLHPALASVSTFLDPKTPKRQETTNENHKKEARLKSQKSPQHPSPPDRRISSMCW
jgi:hypothetical protein